MSIHNISPAELKVKLEQDPTLQLLDVRTPFEFSGGYIGPAKNLPLDLLAEDRLEYLNRDKPIYVNCQSGGRSLQACRRLETFGYNQIYNLNGGLSAWVKAGNAIKGAKKTISLERQVRIAAGLLVVTGVLLGLWVTPYAFGIAGFVGCGLIFAGITDTCGMGLMLSRMPWNRVARIEPELETATPPACSFDPSRKPILSADQ